MSCPSFHQHRGVVPSVGFRDHYDWINYWKRACHHRNREKPTDTYIDKLLPRELVLFKSADHFSQYLSLPVITIVFYKIIQIVRRL